MAYIRDIKVNLSENNACHKTIDSLKCDVCNKKTNRVYVLKAPNNDIRFACLNGKCFPKLFNEMFILYDEPFLYSCSIEDINYSTKKTTKKKVRSEMTLKMRYKIMKRDNFICVICGRRPPEVELCVDHIKPVSNGGTNEESNLRTLCYDCNLGKGVD